MRIVQGSDGVEVRFVVKDDNGTVVKLDDCSVLCEIKKTTISIPTKTTTILDPTNGLCSIVLSKDDLDIGDCYYVFQLVVNFPDGKVFRSGSDKFFVEAKI
jgi:hypothetical protein